MLDPLPLPPVRSLCALLIAGSLTLPAAAQDIQVRISVKFILDSQGLPTQQQFGSATNIADHVDDINTLAMRRFGRGYEFKVIEYLDVVGYPAFFTLDDNNEANLLKTLAPVAPGLLWNANAINMYIVDSAPAATGGDPMVMTGSLPPTTFLHELGHHFGLYHTFDNDNGQGDHVADTQPDPHPLQCTTNFGCALGGAQECCCATKITLLDAASTNWTQQQYDDIYFNSMSYYGASDCAPAHDYTNVRLTPGQLDRWIDTSRLSYSHEVSGLTYFVATNGSPFGSGYSTSPRSTVAGGVLLASSSGNDIVFVRSGSYDETLTLTKAVVLRAPVGGSAVIGK